MKGAVALINPSFPTAVIIAIPNPSFLIPSIFIFIPRSQVKNLTILIVAARTKEGRKVAAPVLFLCSSSPPLDDLIFYDLLAITSLRSSKVLFAQSGNSIIAKSFPPAIYTSTLISTVLNGTY